MRIYTIGFTKKGAKVFFEKLRENNVRCLLDIRLNNQSQLAGFAKGSDLEYFISEILDIEYIYDQRFSPTPDLLKRYKSKMISWKDYEKEFNKIVLDRSIIDVIRNEFVDKLNGICLLCSEDKPDKCHRKIIANHLKLIDPELEIIHL